MGGVCRGVRDRLHYARFHARDL